MLEIEFKYAAGYFFKKGAPKERALEREGALNKLSILAFFSLCKASHLSTLVPRDFCLFDIKK